METNEIAMLTAQRVLVAAGYHLGPTSNGRNGRSRTEIYQDGERVGRIHGSYEKLTVKIRRSACTVCTRWGAGWVSIHGVGADSALICALGAQLAEYAQDGQE